MNLSPRLEAVAAMIPPGARLLDVGTDHAYLPIALLQRGVVEAAIGGDVRSGPLAQARVHAASAGVLDQVDLRQGDGLRVVSPGEVDVAVLAGMGGRLMLQLLEDAPDVVASLERLVLAPNTHAGGVRRWAWERGYVFVAEDLVHEGRHLYPVLCLAPRRPLATGLTTEPREPLTDLEADLGPLLLRQGHPLVPEAARRLIAGIRQKLRGLDERGGDSAIRERKGLTQRLEQLEEVVRCWPKWPI